MAIPEMTDDLNIISDLSNRPNQDNALTSAELKARFDKGPNLIKTFLNTVLIPALNKLDGAAGSKESSEHPCCYYRTVDGETEWLNSPMIVGVEYRTTERCEGLPVYAKRIAYTLSEGIGNTTGNTDTTIAHGISDFNFLVRCFGRKGNYPLPSAGAAGGLISINQVSASGIVWRCYKDTLSAGTIYFDLYYTKTS